MTMIERRYTNENVTTDNKIIRGVAAVHYVEGDDSTQFTLWDNQSGKAVERIERGAFSVTDEPNNQNDIICCFDHDQTKLLGRTSSGTLQVEFTDRGMEYSLKPSKTQLYKDLTEMIKRGDISGSSFRMRITEEEWSKEGEVSVRHIKSGIVEDCSPVVRACYQSADVMVRGKELDTIKDSHKKWQEEIETQEKILWSESL